jgi:hypothetical protein
MEIFLSDKEITELINEEKIINSEVSELLKMKIKKAHKENELTINRLDGSCFKIIIRQNTENQLDFSVILGYIPPNRNDVFILRRYNGKSHEHTNRIEKEKPFYDYHIHSGTERYQEEGPREEYFAEATSRYADIHGALNCLINDCNIKLIGNLELNFLNN